MTPQQQQYGWPMRMGFSVAMGVWITLVMWLVIQNVWVSVFALGVCLGLCVLGKWLLTEEVRLAQHAWLVNFRRHHAA